MTYLRNFVQDFITFVVEKVTASFLLILDSLKGRKSRSQGWTKRRVVLSLN